MIDEKTPAGSGVERLPDGTLDEHSSPSQIIRAVHRTNAGYIAFTRKVANHWQQVFSIPTIDVVARFGQVASFLQQDAYFSINTMAVAGKRKSKLVSDLPAAKRDSRSVLAFNAAYADLDTYRAGLTIGEAFGRVVDLQDNKTIPPASFIIRSGRGLWLFWLLVDAETGKPPEVTEQKHRLYRSIQQSIISRLGEVGADPACVDSARCARVPGSIHSGTGETVRYWPKLDQDCPPFTYMLDGLAKFLTIDQTPRPRTTKQGHRSAGNGKTNHFLPVHQHRLKQFRKLWQLRGGFDEGNRNNAAFLYAHLLFRTGHTTEQVKEELDKFGDSSSPQMAPWDVRCAVRSGQDVKYKFSNATISRLLAITPNEADQLDGWRFAGAEWGQSVTTRCNRSRLVKCRQEAIIQIVKELNGELPPLRRMVALLAEKGIKTSKDSVRRDYLKLGFSCVSLPGGAGVNPVAPTLTPTQRQFKHGSGSGIP